jgi:hypothetical protein
MIAVTNHALQAQGWHNIAAIWAYVSYGWRWLVPVAFLLYFWGTATLPTPHCSCKNCQRR